MEEVKGNGTERRMWRQEKGRVALKQLHVYVKTVTVGRQVCFGVVQVSIRRVQRVRVAKGRVRLLNERRTASGQAVCKWKS